MRRKPLFLIAAAVEIAHFLALSFLAEAMGALREAYGLPLLFRYAAAPQLVFVACFFFLWLDRSRYAAYRPLAIAGKVLSLVSFLPLMLYLVREGVGPLSSSGAGAAVAALGFDLISLLVLCLSARDGAGESGHTPPTEPPSSQGPRSAEDIEKVEA